MRDERRRASQAGQRGRTLAKGSARWRTVALVVRGRAGEFNLPGCVGQRLQDLEVEIEELLDRAPAQQLTSTEARD